MILRIRWIRNQKIKLRTLSLLQIPIKISVNVNTSEIIITRIERGDVEGGGAATVVGIVDFEMFVGI